MNRYIAFESNSDRVCGFSALALAGRRLLGMAPRIARAPLFVAVWILLFTVARAELIVSTGYNDSDGIAGGIAPPGLTVPNPWFGSPNTTFYGSSTDISTAPAADPDLSGVLFQNSGPSAVTIQDVNITAGDLFTRAGLVGPVTLGVGQNAIFCVGDGSDSLGSLQAVGFVINGQSYSVLDATTTSDGRTLASGVLAGGVVGNNFETVPWTEIAVIPEPATAALLTCGALSLLMLRWNTDKRGRNPNCR